jgi:peptide/nickel transport system ATP-binding protein/oligopeptide transport system ATP-binding protein
VTAVEAPVDTLVSVRDLSVEFGGGVRAADGVSFDVRRGEIFGIVGESGSGKSTVIRALIRLLPSQAQVTGGEVRFGDGDLLQLPERRMRKLRGAEIAMVFQDPLSSLNPVLRLGVQIGEGLRWHGRLSAAERHARVIEVMGLVGLPDHERLLRAYPHQLSGGLRQRVGIAIALASSPKLVLADEPTTALDVTIQDQILKLLVDLCDKTGTSVVLVTHDLGVVAQTCQRVAVMYGGRIVETGPVEQIFASPGHPYTRALLDSIPRGSAADGRLVPVPGAPPALDELPEGCRFAPRCRYSEVRCREVDPPLELHNPGQLAACIRHDELREELDA